MKRQLLTVGLTLFSLTLSVEASAATFSKMYVFGDSLSDMGNVFNATTAAKDQLGGLPGISLPPVIPPSPPYANGRYSNGQIWVEFLAESLELTLIPSTDLAFPSPITFDLASLELAVNSFFNGATAKKSVNFAFGGAQTGEQGSGDFGTLIPGILTQVDWFTQDLKFLNPLAKADSEALYVFWGGPNDYWSELNPNPENSVTNLTTAVQSLYNIGARNFLLPNLPDLGITPRGLNPLQYPQPEESQRLTNLTKSHNDFLVTSIANLSLLPEINLIPFDVDSLFNDAIANPENFGLENVTNPCLDINLNQCSEPDKYLFWDDRHPTTATHKQLAQFALVELESHSKSIPEPTPIVPLGLLGLGLWLGKKYQKVG